MSEHTSSSGSRLNKYLALQLGISRREADLRIEQGRVLINDMPATLGARVHTGDTVKIDGRTVTNGTRLQYLMFNKPVGYVSSRRAQGDLPTLYALLPREYHALKPVGRLDQNSSGLLLLTNDGDFAYRMTHPKFHKIKIYEVQLNKPLEPLHQQMISDYGVQLEDGVSRFFVERLDEPLEKEHHTAQYRGVARALGGGAESTNSLRTETERQAPSYIITMSEGRNRQIRRTFKALGYAVTRLHRTNFGDYSLGDIDPGKYKVIKIS